MPPPHQQGPTTTQSTSTTSAGGNPAPTASATPNASSPLAQKALGAGVPPTSAVAAASGVATVPNSDSLSYGEVSTVKMSSALSAELLPPQGFRFDTPPGFDRLAFEESEEEELTVDGHP